MFTYILAEVNNEVIGIRVFSKRDHAVDKFRESVYALKRNPCVKVYHQAQNSIEWVTKSNPRLCTMRIVSGPEGMRGRNYSKYVIQQALSLAQY